MTDFEKRRDEAAYAYDEHQLDAEIEKAFKDGADWARKDCAARAEGLVEALTRIAFPYTVMQNVELEVQYRIKIATEALESFAKEEE